ncbi:hypothetical protein [Pseudomonas phage PA26]|uniref:Uncharacterized protein n=1 Tax=Pseudomonas phage PA26 TaxID=1204542 RepID=I7DJF7_9CAUD|nr:hypothetical protein FDH24_gp06 [Pseudomonas phage PA26]AFO70505.1 hypothetical protein [Pseudomonas phage PA26]
MRTIAQLVKLGLEYYEEHKSPPYMCFVLADMFDHKQITEEEYSLCKNWVYEKIPLYASPVVLGYLVQSGLKATRENWVQFYVWAYYDLVKGDHHARQP